ncbi:hypothetical protein PoB_001870700 [Plakobranchus ocellatus]|uniref:Uncharacterized protein n=1 Tax=Plakobranchus ocellatus TaxID=259542 RepID=A0AAV3ZCJ1_9GAST|nr:hypothetical protein PoB_001870700 [Plakobranchus ocellatus]
MHNLATSHRVLIAHGFLTLQTAAGVCLAPEADIPLEGEKRLANGEEPLRIMRQGRMDIVRDIIATACRIQRWFCFLRKQDYAAPSHKVAFILFLFFRGWNWPTL